MTEDILELHRIIRKRHFGLDLSRLHIEAPRSVPDDGTLFGRGIAFALYGLNVKELGAIEVLDVSEDTDESLDIVPIDRSYVSDAEALEEVMSVAEEGFEAVVESKDA